MLSYVNEMKKSTLITRTSPIKKRQFINMYGANKCSSYGIYYNKEL